MAESEVEELTLLVPDDDKKLKYLDFVQAAAVYVLACFSSIYEYAKENSGPLKPGVKTVEATVKTVIGPVYDKFRDIPFELFKFVDRKIENFLGELGRLVPSLVKHASNQARSVACEVQRAGVVDAAKNIAKRVYEMYEPMAWELYCMYEPVAEHYAVSVWRCLNRLPLFPQAAQIAVPTAAYWSEKYNEIVCYTADRGYPAAAYLPLIPIEWIAKVFDGGVNGPTISSNGEAVTEL
ncbi:stress-related protein [Ricinus communis]|uniref:Small rubber particle protein, putative n=1 Tax=Ricinus communis TaxID=3988 RepID=B9T0W5_RICCO|nr:stress-related protein [Ricinus communis]EEF30521.1 Small rubber particle protein, putative [Ricinus communis]|eukprot:XP_002531884.1 stress-related protein isoform X2 [Ricinus communis]